jgi:hypothetical protein
MSNALRLARAGFVATLTLTTLMLTSVASGAATVPFTDQSANGSIGLCDAGGNPIRSGSMTQHPFAELAASSIPAPDGYTAQQKAKATLYAFQPRQNVDPGQWSGQQLTGSSIYSDASRPMVAGTNLDASLQDFVSAYPARWQGLVQLRIYYTAPNKVPFRRSYPAAVLRVSGSNWTVVQGADVPCDSGKVISSERLLLPSSAFKTANPAATKGSVPTMSPGANASASSGTKPSSAATAPVASGSTTSRSGEVAAAAAKQRSSSTAPWFTGVAVLGATAVAGALLWRRRVRG